MRPDPELVKIAEAWSSHPSIYGPVCVEVCVDIHDYIVDTNITAAKVLSPDFDVSVVTSVAE